LVPVHLFLEKDMIVFLLKATLKKDMVEWGNSLHIMLNPFQFVLNVSFALEDVSQISWLKVTDSCQTLFNAVVVMWLEDV
jgi:hypothetical protein